MRHGWPGLRPGQRWSVDFAADNGPVTFEAAAVVLALGGGLWPETGSDGGWIPVLESLGVAVAPLVSANCGWEVAWPPAVLASAEGKPLKNITSRAGGITALGELLVTRYGLEGGVIYQLEAALRAMAEQELVIDFKPSHTVGHLVKKIGAARRDFLAEAAHGGVCATRRSSSWAIGRGRGYASAEALTATVKHCPVRLIGPRPLAEAISSAGGALGAGVAERCDLNVKRSTVRVAARSLRDGACGLRADPKLTFSKKGRILDKLREVSGRSVARLAPERTAL